MIHIHFYILSTLIKNKQPKQLFLEPGPAQFIPASLPKPNKVI